MLMYIPYSMNYQMYLYGYSKPKLGKICSIICKEFADSQKQMECQGGIDDTKNKNVMHSKYIWLRNICQILGIIIFDYLGKFVDDMSCLLSINNTNYELIVPALIFL